jgi:hypothetical protein
LVLNEQWGGKPVANELPFNFAPVCFRWQDISERFRREVKRAAGGCEPTSSRALRSGVVGLPACQRVEG